MRVNANAVLRSWTLLEGGSYVPDDICIYMYVRYKRYNSVCESRNESKGLHRVDCTLKISTGAPKTRTCMKNRVVVGEGCGNKATYLYFLPLPLFFSLHLCFQFAASLYVYIRRKFQ